MNGRCKTRSIFRLVGFIFENQIGKESWVEGSEDDMLRADSSREYFAQWKHQFSSYDSHGTHIYGLYDSDVSAGFIYVIGEVGSDNFKIGFTSNPDIERRRAALQTGNANDLVVRGSFSCTSNTTERLLHRLFSDCRRQGEWFALSEEQVSAILNDQWRRENFVF